MGLVEVGVSFSFGLQYSVRDWWEVEVRQEWHITSHIANKNKIQRLRRWGSEVQEIDIIPNASDARRERRVGFCAQEQFCRCQAGLENNREFLSRLLIRNLSTNTSYRINGLTSDLIPGCISWRCTERSTYIWSTWFVRVLRDWILFMLKLFLFFLIKVVSDWRSFRLRFQFVVLWWSPADTFHFTFSLPLLFPERKDTLITAHITDLLS